MTLTEPCPIIEQEQYSTERNYEVVWCFLFTELMGYSSPEVLSKQEELRDSPDNRPQKKDPLSVRRTATDRGKGHQGRLASPLTNNLHQYGFQVKRIFFSNQFYPTHAMSNDIHMLY